MSLLTMRKRFVQSVRAFGKQNSAIFDDVYRARRWGGEGVYSGAGSSEDNSRPYEELVADFVTAHGIKSLVDVGCGDFQVSQRLLARLAGDVTYTGLDVSQVVVERNTRSFASDRIRFAQCDAAHDDLPPADLVLVREVLQHLSNKDILAILPKLWAYPHALVTNTRMLDAFPKNVDQASGASAREATCGGLWLDLPPFNCAIEELLAVRHSRKPAEIVTVRLMGPEA